MHPLSAVIITRNAADQLPGCLASLDFCDEILVVDSGSTDDTVALARQHGARVIETHWRGYGPQKQFAVTQASHDWVLCVDADERVTQTLRAAITAVLPAFNAVAYRIARRNRFMGRYLRHGEGYPDWNLRLFHRDYARWSDDPVHEHVIVSDPDGPDASSAAVGTLAGDLLHDSAESMDRYLEKQNLYSSLAAQAALAAGKRSSAVRLLLSPLLRFVKFYFFRLGLLDGVPGLVHILIGCYASFAKHAKMLDCRTERLTKPPS